jgi:hypothetical protein
MDGILTPEQLQALEAQAAQEQQGLQRQAMQQNLERDAALVAKYSDLARTESKLPWYMPRYDEMGNPNAVPVPSGVRLEYARKATDIQNEINKRVQSTLPKTPQEVDAALSAYLGTPVKNDQTAPSSTQPQPTPAPEATTQPATVTEQRQQDPFSQFASFIKKRDETRARAIDYVKNNFPREDLVDGLEMVQKMTEKYFPAPRNIAQPIIDQFTGKPLEGFALIGGKVEKIEKPKAEDDGRSVIGYEGKAPTQGEAVEFRRKTSMINSGLNDLDELILLGKKGSSLSPQDRSRASNLATIVAGKFRKQIIGEGAVTDQDRRILDQIVPNPLQVFTLVDIPALLTDMKRRLQSSVDSDAAILGLKPTGQSSQPSQGGGDGGKSYVFDPSRNKVVPK